MVNRRSDRLEKIINSAVSEILNINGLENYQGSIAEDIPGSWRTIQRILGELNEEGSSEKSLKITTLSVIGTDDDHTIFGLGNDGKPYVWDSGSWIQHA